MVLQTLREGVRGSQTYRHYEKEAEIERHKQASNDVLQTLRERGQNSHIQTFQKRPTDEMTFINIMRQTDRQTDQARRQGITDPMTKGHRDSETEREILDKQLKLPD